MMRFFEIISMLRISFGTSSTTGILRALLVVVICNNLQLWLGVYEMSGGGGTQQTLGLSGVAR